MENILIFDYDGVLIDSLDIFMKHFLNSCKKNQVSEIKDKNDFLNLFNKNMYESMFNLGLSKQKILKIVKIVKDNLIKDQKKIRLFDGIKVVLEKLATKNKLYIVTSNDSTVVENLFKINKIDFFDEIIGSDKEPSKIKKIEHIKKRHNGSDFFFIGDTRGDIIEGKKAKIKTIAVSWGWHQKKELEKEHPDIIIEQPQDFLKIFM